MRHPALSVAMTVSLALLAACGTAPGSIGTQSLQTLCPAHQTMAQQDQGAQGQNQAMGQQDQGAQDQKQVTGQQEQGAQDQKQAMGQQEQGAQDQKQVMGQQEQGAQDQKQVMGQQDVSGILQQAREAASSGDKAKILSLLQQAKSSLGSGVMSEGSPMQPVAKHLDQAISQIQAADVNVREVASILVNQLQESLKVTQGGQAQSMTAGQGADQQGQRQSMSHHEGGGTGGSGSSTGDSGTSGGSSGEGSTSGTSGGSAS